MAVEKGGSAWAMEGKWGKTAGIGRSVADHVGPRAFSLQPVPPGAPWCAGFGLGLPVVILAQIGDKQQSGGATWPMFRRRR